MRIVARIEKMEGGQYVYDGRTFDCFLSARREMAQQMKQRRLDRRERTSRGILKQLQAVGAYG